MKRIITAIGNMHKKFGEDQTCSSGDMIAGWSKKYTPVTGGITNDTQP